MSRWISIGDRIFSELGALRVKAPFSDRTNWSTLPGLLELLYSRERQSRAQVDEAVALWSQTGRRAELAAWPGYFRFQRFSCATDFCAQLSEEDNRGSIVVPAPADNVCNDAELLNHLLIGMWTRRHDHWLKLVALSVALNRPFYGLEPARDGS